MKIPALFAGIPASYLVAAVIFGIVVAFGVGAMTYRPLPVQVQINQYAPMKAPEPAIPTVAPTVNPGPQSPYAPAPAPVVVTTAPLPKITAVPTETITLSCDVNAGDPASGTACMVEETMPLIASIVQMMFILVTVGMILSIFGVITSGAFGRDPPNI